MMIDRSLNIKKQLHSLSTAIILRFCLSVYINQVITLTICYRNGLTKLEMWSASNISNLPMHIDISYACVINLINCTRARFVSRICCCRQCGSNYQHWRFGKFKTTTPTSGGKRFQQNSTKFVHIIQQNMYLYFFSLVLHNIFYVSTKKTTFSIKYNY